MGEVLAELVAQVGVRVAVADDFHWLGAADTSVVGGDDDFDISLCQLAEEV